LVLQVWVNGSAILLLGNLRLLRAASCMQCDAHHRTCRRGLLKWQCVWKDWKLGADTVFHVLSILYH
jgi:hypothetical protein